MPRSKRNKVVSLTKTKEKGRTLKSKSIEVLRSAVDEYSSIYLFTFENLRASKFRDIRLTFRESRIFMGKNSIAQIALGRTPEDEFKDNLRNISNRLVGDVGLLFTSRSKEEVVEFFSTFSSPEYAKAGAIPESDIVIPPGLLDFSSSMLDHFRTLGLVVEVENGKVALRESYVAARLGEPLTPEQAKILTHMKMPIATFTISLNCHWQDGNFEEF